MTNILITGGSGFVGTNLVLYLRDRGFQVLSIDPSPPRVPDLMDITQIVDPLDELKITEILKEFRPDFVYHLGARTDLHGSRIEEYSANTQALQCLINAVKVTPSIKAIYFASSRLVCRIGYQPMHDADYCPTTAYGESKQLGEKIIRKSGLEIPWCIFRPTSIWGPWFDIPYKTFFMCIATGKYFHPHGIRIMKSFGFVGNSVYQLAKLMDADPTRYNTKTFYLCDYPALEVGHWGDLIAREMGVKVPRRVPFFVLRTLAKIGDVLIKVGMKNPPLTSFRLDNLVTPMEMDTNPIEELIGALPFTAEDGVRITVDWLRQSGQIRLSNT